MQHREPVHGQWSSHWAFFLAAAGSAIGLGNIWKFPYITGEYGGGAFVLVYLLCIAMVGIPIMIAEILMGRRGRRSPINTMRYLAESEGHSSAWHLLGWSGIVAGFLILSYYSVIAGWALAYVARAAGGLFTGMDSGQSNVLFTELTSDPERLLAWHTIFMVMTIVVVSRGVAAGLEKSVKIMMPALFAILLVLVGYAMTSGHFGEGLAFLFTPDFSKLTPNAVVVAMGHSFFTLSLGMGAIMAYGSYLPKQVSIARTTLAIAVADTTVALLAGMAIFPIVFANGMPPGSGPGLVFQTLPIAFGQMPGGAFFGTLFFVLVVFAAWTSSISLVEPAVAWLVENRGHSRVGASAWVGLLAWALGIGTILSFNHWSGAEYQVFGKTLFDILDYLTANIMLPLGGLAIAVYVGWFMRRDSVQDELGEGGSIAFRAWYLVLRYVAPIGVLAIFFNAIGLIRLNG